MKQSSVRAVQRWYNWHYGKPEGKEWKVYGSYSGGSNRIALNLAQLDEESQFTLVYILTHEFLHYWLLREVGLIASFKLDPFGHREHFPITDDEPLIKPLKWGGIHKRSLFHLIWVYIVMNHWRAWEEERADSH